MKKHLLSFLLLFVIATSSCIAQNPILWGMTEIGGANNLGAIFGYDASTDKETVVHSFGSDTDGKYPGYSLIQASNGLLYGVTINGGANDGGIIFSYNISNGGYTNLYDFGDNSQPIGSLLEASNGLIYGTAYSGGIGLGTIFSYDILTDKETDLYDFTDTTTDGAFPSGSLIQVNDSMLYGTTAFGGSYAGGTIFSYNILTKRVTIIHSFGSGFDGSYPCNSPIQASNGLLYGTTAYGGTNNSGTIFSYNISTDTEIILHNFGSGTDGIHPAFYGSLIQIKDSLLYGLTCLGGDSDVGVIFNYNILTDTETVLHSFGEGADGKSPNGTLIQASNGLLYGTTAYGGINDSGTIFTYNISTDTETVMYDFDDIVGVNPRSNLLEVDTPIAPTGINQLSAINNQLSIYPNPTSGQFTIKLNRNQNGYMVQIYNVVGEEIYESVNKSAAYTSISSEGDLGVNLGTQPAGIYFVYLKSEEGVEVGKVMVAR